MFKNKKEPKKEATGTEIFSLSSDNMPIKEKEISVNPPLSKVDREENDNQTKKGASHVLWAKILVIIIIGFVSVLGIYKFANYLNMPKALFKSVVETIHSDLISLANTIEEDEIFKALYMDSYEISLDSKVMASGLENNDEHLEDVLNALKYISTIEVDRRSNGIDASMRATKDSVEKFTLNYLEKEHRKFVSIPQIHGQFIELENDFDFLAINPEEIKNTLELIKDQLIVTLENRRISSENSSIAVNGQTVDCIKSTYEFNNLDMTVLIDSLYNTIKSNDTSYSFIANLIGLDKNGLDDKFDELKEYLGLSNRNVYEFSAYTKKDSKKGIRLEFHFNDLSYGENNSISYSIDEDYRSFEVKTGSSVKTISIKGNLESTYTINVLSKNKTYDFTIKTTDNGKEGIFFLGDNDTDAPKTEGGFSYDIKKNSNTSYSIDSTVEIKNRETPKGDTYKISSAAIINGKNSIDITDKVSNSIEIAAYEKDVGTSLREKFKDMLRGISIADIQPPQVFTPETSGEIPSQE